jgi:hypothetical protein
MTEEIIRELKRRYPAVNLEEFNSLSIEDYNKCRISFLEKLSGEYKDMLQDVFRSGKTWSCSQEELEWYKLFVREQKNSVDISHKEVVSEQKNLREGLNPPFMYKF